MRLIDADAFKEAIIDACDAAILTMENPEAIKYVVETTDAICKDIDEFPSADVPDKNVVKWIPVKTRPMDPEEKVEWEERLGVILTKEEAVIFTGDMPEDGQEILICSKYGHVTVDQCINDEYGLGLESNGDWDCITAWMALPDPYKGGEE